MLISGHARRLRDAVQVDAWRLYRVVKTLHLRLAPVATADWVGFGRESVVAVAVAVIRRGNRFLCGLRRAERDFGLLWEFPGGKVELGEGASTAVQRELGEECGLDEVRIEAVPLVKLGIGLDDGTWIALTCLRAHITDDAVPRALDHLALGWFTIEELWCLDLIPSMLAILPVLEKESRCAT